MTKWLLFIFLPCLIGRTFGQEFSLHHIEWPTTLASDPPKLPQAQENLLPLVRTGLGALPEPLLMQASGMGAMFFGVEGEDQQVLQSGLASYYQQLATDPGFESMPSALSYCWSSTKPDHGFATLYLPENSVGSIVFLHGYAGSFQFPVHFLAKLFPDHVILAPAWGISPSRISSEYIDEAILTAEKEFSVQLKNPVLIGLSAGGFGAFFEYCRRPHHWKALISLAAPMPHHGLTNIPETGEIYVLAGGAEYWVADRLRRTDLAFGERSPGVIYESKTIPEAGHFFLLTHPQETRQQLSRWMKQLRQR